MEYECQLKGSNDLIEISKTHPKNIVTKSKSCIYCKNELLNKFIMAKTYYNNSYIKYKTFYSYCNQCNIKYHN